ncbi:MAG TPA: GntR family transcriptional regulator, partial [Thalassospira sp.]|nr:GntR family transcriptional regulator [Thalassospira sp.]
HAASARFLFSGFRMEWEAPTDQDHRAILKALRERQFDISAATLARHVKWIGTKPGPKIRPQTLS